MSTSMTCNRVLSTPALSAPSVQKALPRLCPAQPASTVQKAQLRLCPVQPASTVQQARSRLFRVQPTSTVQQERPRLCPAWLHPEATVRRVQARRPPYARQGSFAQAAVEGQCSALQASTAGKEALLLRLAQRLLGGIAHLSLRRRTACYATEDTPALVALHSQSPAPLLASTALVAPLSTESVLLGPSVKQARQHRHRVLQNQGSIAQPDRAPAAVPSAVRASSVQAARRRPKSVWRASTVRMAARWSQRAGLRLASTALLGRAQLVALSARHCHTAREDRQWLKTAKLRAGDSAL